MPKSKYYYASSREEDSSDDTDSTCCDCRYCEKLKVKRCCSVKEKYKNHFIKSDHNHNHNYDCNECCAESCHSNKKRERCKDHDKINKKECQDKKVIIITIS
jgi:hypothetical protein